MKMVPHSEGPNWGFPEKNCTSHVENIDFFWSCDASGFRVEFTMKIPWKSNHPSPGIPTTITLPFGTFPRQGVEGGFFFSGYSFFNEITTVYLHCSIWKTLSIFFLPTVFLFFLLQKRYFCILFNLMLHQNTLIFWFSFKSVYLIF